MCRSKTLFVLSCCCVVLLAPAVTPARSSQNAGVCDGLIGATPSLYGLCIAFCEAQDCVPDYTVADPFGHCTPASARLLDLYNQRKQPTDPPMPCVQVSSACPCFDAEDVAAIPTPYDQCIVDFSFGGNELTTNIIFNTETNGTGAEQTIGPFSSFCSFGNGLVDPPIFVSLETTPEQAQACRQLLVDRIEADEGQCELLCDPVCE